MPSFRPSVFPVGDATHLQSPSAPGMSNVLVATGVKGDKGDTGDTGSPGLVWQGDYNPSTVYHVPDVVFYEGGSYVMTVSAGTAGKDPVTYPQYWDAVATGGTNASIAWSNITGKPTSFTPSTHKTTHATGGADALAPSDIGAASATHTHSASDVTNFTTAAQSAVTRTTLGISTTDNVTFASTTTNYLALATSASVTVGAGQMAWNATEGTLDLGLDTSAVLQVGQETLYRVTNASTTTAIADGALVMAYGTTGNSGQIKVKPWDGSQAPKTIMGLATEEIPANGSGYVTHFGKVRGIKTNGRTSPNETWSDGDILYAYSGGGMTNVLPSAPNTKTAVAIVIHAHATNGTLFVRPTYGSRLDEDDMVQISGIANGHLIAYNSSTSRFENKAFTKSDVGLGNVENTALSTWAGSSNLTTVGTVTSGTWHGTALADAYISSASTWNAKEPAISAASTSPTTKFWRGDKSWQTLDPSAISGLLNIGGYISDSFLNGYYSNLDCANADTATEADYATNAGHALTADSVGGASGGTVTIANNTHFTADVEIDGSTTLNGDVVFGTGITVDLDVVSINDLTAGSVTTDSLEVGTTVGSAIYLGPSARLVATSSGMTIETYTGSGWVVQATF